MPAQLDSLAIYNPSLSSSDESLSDQIVFYHSRRARKQRDHNEDDKQKTTPSTGTEENDRLRQIGLAQGMVNFAK